MAMKTNFTQSQLDALSAAIAQGDVRICARWTRWPPQASTLKERDASLSLSTRI
jgi:hypothetical protein